CLEYLLAALVMLYDFSEAFCLEHMLLPDACGTQTPKPWKAARGLCVPSMTAHKLFLDISVARHLWCSGGRVLCHVKLV
ncbi:hypothetical protein RRG08_017288, partial [Elysia crispata]